MGRSGGSVRLIGQARPPPPTLSPAPMRNPQHIDRKPYPHPSGYMSLVKPQSGAQIGRGGTMGGGGGGIWFHRALLQKQSYLQVGKLSDKQETFKDFKELLSLQNKVPHLLKSKSEVTYPAVQRPKCLIKKSLASKSKACFKKLFLLSEIFFSTQKRKKCFEEVRQGPITFNRFPCPDWHRNRFRAMDLFAS